MKQSEQKKAESVSERLNRAILFLCTQPGDVRSRLNIAGQCILPLQKDDFPKHLSSRFKSIIEVITEKNTISIDVKMKKIRNSTGEKIAKDIFQLHLDNEKIRTAAH